MNTHTPQPDTTVTDSGHAIGSLEDRYLAALDEIRALRAAAAYEASAIEAHLSYKTFPKSRRGIAEEQIERLQAAARGDAAVAYADRSHLSVRHALHDAGAAAKLTVTDWENNRPGLRRADATSHTRTADTQTRDPRRRVVITETESA